MLFFSKLSAHFLGKLFVLYRTSLERDLFFNQLNEVFSISRIVANVNLLARAHQSALPSH